MKSVNEIYGGEPYTYEAYTNEHNPLVFTSFQPKLELFHAHFALKRFRRKNSDKSLIVATFRCHLDSIVILKQTSSPFSPSSMKFIKGYVNLVWREK